MAKSLTDRIKGGLQGFAGIDQSEALRAQLLGMQIQNEQAKMLAQQKFQDWIMSGAGNAKNPDIGMTGYDYNPVSGDVSLKFGQTPSSKAGQEVKTQVSKDAMGRVQKLQELIPVLDQFENYLNAIPVGTGTAGRLEGVGKALSAPFQTDPYVATAMTQLDALRPQIARGFGDVGNLSQTEQQTAKKFIQQTADNAETRVLKGLGGLTFIRRKIVNAIEKSGMTNDEQYKTVLSQLDKRIQNQYNKAMTLGMDKDRVNKFLGMADMKLSDVPLKMDKDIARSIMKEAGGDPKKAREIAKTRGFEF